MADQVTRGLLIPVARHLGSTAQPVAKLEFARKLLKHIVRPAALRPLDQLGGIAAIRSDLRTSRRLSSFATELARRKEMSRIGATIQRISLQ